VTKAAFSSIRLVPASTAYGMDSNDVEPARDGLEGSGAHLARAEQRAARPAWLQAAVQRVWLERGRGASRPCIEVDCGAISAGSRAQSARGLLAVPETDASAADVLVHLSHPHPVPCFPRCPLQASALTPGPARSAATSARATSASRRRSARTARAPRAAAAAVASSSR